MIPSFALFTTCKPFGGAAGDAQRSALRSWRLAHPDVPILVFGDEHGTAEHCAVLGLAHVPTLSRTAGGAPRVDRLFADAEARTSAPVLVYANADVALTGGLDTAVAAASAALPAFLLVSRRWNVPLEKEWDFDGPRWAEELAAFARARGRLEAPYGGIDLFAFTRGLWRDLPPYALGRRRWDSGLVLRARELGAPVVDATDAVVTVHPDHPPYRPPGPATATAEDARRNEGLLGGDARIFTALNATHRLGPLGLEKLRALRSGHVLRRLATLPALHPRARWLSPLVRALAPLWRATRRGPAPQHERM